MDRDPSDDNWFKDMVDNERESRHGEADYVPERRASPWYLTALIAACALSGPLAIVLAIYFEDPMLLFLALPLVIFLG